MKILSCLFLFLITSCSPKVFNKHKYEKAMEWLAYTDPPYNIEWVPRSALKKRLPIVFNSDTTLAVSDTRFHKGDTVFSKSDKNTFVFRNTENGKIFVFHFLGNAWATRFELDRYWNLIQYHANFAEVY